MAEWTGGPIMSAVAMANATSDYIRLQGFDVGAAISFQCVSASNTHVGTIQVQQSIDNTNWVPVTLQSGDTTVAVAVNTAFNDIIHLKEGTIAAQYVRVVYVNTSGDGTLTVTPHGRGL